MRNTCAISFAAFYLLLTTGMYVCILHCTGEYLFTLPASNHHYSEEAKPHDETKPHSHEKGPCSKDEDCKCCNQHNQYAISENIQTAGSPFFSAIAILSFANPTKDFFSAYRELKPIDWPKGNAPPGVLKIPLYVTNRTLLI
ncbi:MAG TPA: hypothetical protein VL125_09585 [Pelobium sp.]|nr:hypothetical protein [Pelobium sp.]